MLKSLTIKALLAAALFMTVGAGTSEAALILVNTRAGLMGNDFVDWGNAGANFAQLSNPFSVASNLGDIVTVNKALGGNFQRLNQGAGWNGNFAPGDELIWTQNFGSTSNNPVAVFNFDGAGISAGGAQIQANFFGSFTARIEAFDASNNSLGFFLVPGFSSSAGDNSAIFVGVRSTDTMISRIAFSITAATGNSIGDFAINQFDFDTTAIPEPATITLCGLVGVGFVAYRLRRRRSVVA